MSLKIVYASPAIITAKMIVNTLIKIDFKVKETIKKKRLCDWRGATKVIKIT
jgi:hypothetical protein